jgi:hypothetical protein
VLSTNEYCRACTPRHGTVCLTGCKDGGEVTLRSMMRIENRDKSDSRISVFGEKRRGRKRQIFLGSWQNLRGLSGARQAFTQRDAGSERGYQINIALVFGINCATNPQKGLPLLTHRVEDHFVPPTIAAHRKFRT